MRWEGPAPPAVVENMPEPPLRVLKLALLLPPPLLPRLAAASPAALDASTASAAAAAAASTAADGRGCLTGILGLLLAAADEENLHACITSPCKEALPEQNQTIIEQLIPCLPTAVIFNKAAQNIAGGMEEQKAPLALLQQQHSTESPM